MHFDYGAQATENWLQVIFMLLFENKLCFYF